MENENIFSKTKALKLNLGDYAVVSGGVLEAHGIRESGDVDLVVSNEVFERLLNEGWSSKIGANGQPVLFMGEYEVALDWGIHGYRPDPQKLIEEAEIIDGVPFVSLEEVVKFKKEFGREKDINDLALIEEYLRRTTESRSQI